MNDLEDKTLLVTGGTGSFGKAVLKNLRSAVKEIQSLVMKINSILCVRCIMINE